MLPEWCMCAVMKSTGSSLVIIFACKGPHQLHHGWWVVPAREWSWQKSDPNGSLWDEPTVSTCQAKQSHLWMNKRHCASYLLRWLHHFLWKKERWNTSCSPSLTEDTVAPSGCLLQLQSFVSGLGAAKSHWHIVFVWLSLTVELVVKLLFVLHTCFTLLSVGMYLSVCCSYESGP